jgi:TRAP-type C4-dicarboxylate transport system permease large subunit
MKSVLKKYNTLLGYRIPPVSMNIFLAAIRFNRPRLRVARDTLLFLLFNNLVVLVITYIPLFAVACRAVGTHTVTSQRRRLTHSFRGLCK